MRFWEDHSSSRAMLITSFGKARLRNRDCVKSQTSFRKLCFLCENTSLSPIISLKTWQFSKLKIVFTQSRTRMCTMNRHENAIMEVAVGAAAEEAAAASVQAFV